MEYEQEKLEGTELMKDGYKIFESDSGAIYCLCLSPAIISKFKENAEWTMLAPIGGFTVFMNRSDKDQYLAEGFPPAMKRFLKACNY